MTSIQVKSYKYIYKQDILRSQNGLLKYPVNMLKGIDTNLLQKHAVSKTSSGVWDNSRHQLPALRKGKPLPMLLFHIFMLNMFEISNKRRVSVSGNNVISYKEITNKCVFLR